MSNILFTPMAVGGTGNIAIEARETTSSLQCTAPKCIGKQYVACVGGRYKEPSYVFGECGYGLGENIKPTVHQCHDVNNPHWCSSANQCVKSGVYCSGEIVAEHTEPHPDAHGCIISAGYEWCGVLNKCIRPWETQCKKPECNKNACSGTYLFRCVNGFYKPGVQVDGKCGYVKTSTDTHGCNLLLGQHWCDTTSSCLDRATTCETTPKIIECYQNECDYATHTLKVCGGDNRWVQTIPNSVTCYVSNEVVTSGTDDDDDTDTTTKRGGIALPLMLGVGALLVVGVVMSTGTPASSQTKK